MGWLCLSFAILLDVFGTVSLKLSNGFTKVFPSLMMAMFYVLSIIAFAYAIKKMDISLAYALWTGFATILMTTIGIFYFNEPSNLFKISCIGLIVIGAIGLKLQSS